MGWEAEERVIVVRVAVTDSFDWTHEEVMIAYDQAGYPSQAATRKITALPFQFLLRWRKE
jgi:hypothetical protein